MGNPLTDRATPGELADRGQLIDFKGKIAGFERIASALRDELDALEPADVPQHWRELPVAIKLRFHWADSRRQLPAVEGSAAAKLVLVCQRCLVPFEKELKEPLRLLFAASAGGVSEGGGYDVWEIEDETIRPLDIIEEALVMALPMTAMHEDPDACKTPMPTAQQDDESGTVKPFAGLRSKMRDVE